MWMIWSSFNYRKFDKSHFPWVTCIQIIQCIKLFQLTLGNRWWHRMFVAVDHPLSLHFTLPPISGECYEAKIPCSSLCKCVGCKNYSQTHSTLQELADVAVVRHQQQSSVSAKFSSQLQNMSHSAPDLAPLDDMNLDCLSMNLAAATCRYVLSTVTFPFIENSWKVVI